MDPWPSVEPRFDWLVQAARRVGDDGAVATEVPSGAGHHLITGTQRMLGLMRGPSLQFFLEKSAKCTAMRRLSIQWTPS